MTFTFFEILIIIGLSQGMVTAVLLLTSRDKQLSKRILGITVLVFCVAICRTLLHTSGLWNTLTFRYFPVGMELFLPPLVYCYVLALIEKEFSFKPRHIWFFAPGICYAVYDIGLYALVLQEDTFASKRALSEQLYFDQINQLEDYLIVLLTLGFVYAGAQKIIAYLSWLKQFKAHKNLPIYRWLRSIVQWSALLGAVLLLNELLDTISLAMDIQYYRWRFFNLFLAFMTYYLGFMGYRQDGLKVHESQQLLRSRSQKLNAENSQDIEDNLLVQLEQERVYLDAGLTIKLLAAKLNVAGEALSLVINQKFAMSFRDLLNSYRVKHFKQLARKQAGHASVLSLALDSGFNSQASFYRAFKKFEGMSPKAFINQSGL